MSPSATDVLRPFQALVSMWSIDPINIVNSALGNLLLSGSQLNKQLHNKTPACTVTGYSVRSPVVLLHYQGSKGT